MKELEELIESVLYNGEVSSTERMNLKSVLKQKNLSAHELAALRDKAFGLYKSRLNGSNDMHMLEVLEELIGMLVPGDEKVQHQDASVEEAWFSPGEDCKNAILRHLDNAKKQVEICVFTISDNELAQKILQLHLNDVKIRILTDDDKVNDKGSDIDYLAQNGIEVKTDFTRYHMHHKFVVIDDEILITGSFNWTYTATAHNQENILITSSKVLVEKYKRCFEQLWQEMMTYNEEN